MTQAQPGDVFTPRSASVNPRTYISRPDLEKQLKRSLQMPKHIVIHGESGAGKSWLYKKILNELDVYYEVANMGLCTTDPSIKSVLAAMIGQRTASVSQSREVAVGVPALAGGRLTENSTIVISEDPFKNALQHISERSCDGRSCLVFDNLEQISKNPILIRELCGLLLLVDDEQYAQFEVKILLVGTSNEIRSIIHGADFSATLVNRLIEIQEVGRLTEEQGIELARRGFIDELGCEFWTQSAQSIKRLLSLINYHSDRIPQFLQELCLHIALSAEENDWILSPECLQQGCKDWIRTSLVKDVARVECNLNSVSTRIGRRNQVIFCLGLCKKYDISRDDIEKALRTEFPVSSNGVALNVGQILTDLTRGEHPLLAKSPKQKCYRFVDPKFRIVIRWMLFKDQECQLHFNDFDNSLSLWATESESSLT